jgi:hypothetical protein
MLSRWIKKVMIIKICNRSEIRTITGNLSSVKRDDDKVIVEDGKSPSC